MHGREGEERKRRQHMRPVSPPTVAAPPAAAPGDSSISLTSDSFQKDGRKISVGDCALFQAGNSPPFIGIIRWLTSEKADNIKLGVNWLYRPADVKLCKGILLEAAPNEVFYSFHQDEIPAAVLLHPCKVAFLRKGVELPSGIPAFVCRRVYDITNKCLWWLTDQDYINERQEEVDQLLEKTRLEMHAAVQSGGRSPKSLHGPASTQQLKPGSDSAQNSTTLYPSQGKGKKRERSDQGTDCVKRERSSKADDGDTVHLKLEGSFKAEIAKITDKEGGLVNFEGVEKLVNLMHLNRGDKRTDLVGRIMLADVIAATEKLDCLTCFVSLRGVPILNDWLREVHKGKIGDGSSPKESDRSVEELLLALLRALDKLPVNLNALQTCNVGKSVNHLRSHKNLEIQKKARTLVDTWKKRVEAEMKIIDAKSGPNQGVPWQHGKTGSSEASHGGNKRTSSYEVSVKGSITHPSASRTGSAKPCQGDAFSKSASSSPGSVKLTSTLHASVTNSKDQNTKLTGGSGTLDSPLTPIKEEKSSGSSQSQNNSQSCSSDHTKTAASAWKEDARSSTDGSMTINKASSGATRTRKSSNGNVGSNISGVQKETALGKASSLSRNAPDKLSQSGLTCEKTYDVPSADHGNNHRLIVRLPNPGRSSAQSASGGSVEDPSVMGSRASSPGVSDKLDLHDRRTKGMGDTSQPNNVPGDVNGESWQSNDMKDGLAGSDEGDRSPAAVLAEEHSRNGGDVIKPMDMSKAACSSSGSGKGVLAPGPRTRKSFEPSLKSMNALIESCAKYSEASAYLSADDDLGMILLASVAAGEISKSPDSSPGRNSPSPEDSLLGNNSKFKSSIGDMVQGQSRDNADGSSEKHGDGAVLSQVKDDAREISTQTVNNFLGDGKTLLPSPEHKVKVEESGQCLAIQVDLHQTVDLCSKSDRNADEMVVKMYATVPTDTKEEVSEVDEFNHSHEKRKMIVGMENNNGSKDSKVKVRSVSSDENKVVDSAHEVAAESKLVASDIVRSSLDDGCDIDPAASHKNAEKETVDESFAHSILEIDSEKLNVAHGGSTDGISTEQQQQLLHSPVAANHDEASLSTDVEDAAATGPCQCPDNVDGSRPEEMQILERSCHLESSGDYERMEQPSVTHPDLTNQVVVGSLILDHNKSEKVEEPAERKEFLECSPEDAPIEEFTTVTAQVMVNCAKPVRSKSSGTGADEAEECLSTAEASSANMTGPDLAIKLDFDLNEGFQVDEGSQEDMVTVAEPASSFAVHLPSQLSFSSASFSSGLPVPVTVAAPAKGPFDPPENLMKSKGELGWKGPADTSAFRPAEPRKVLEMSLNGTHIPSFYNIPGKRGRPPMDIDLNMPDERVLIDMSSQCSVPDICYGSGPINHQDSKYFGSATSNQSVGGLDLDLNRVDEGTDNGQFSVTSYRRVEVPLVPARPSSPSGFPNAEANVSRDFDLNNGPGFDEAGLDHPKSTMPYLPLVPGQRMTNAELGNLSSWFPSCNPYPTAAIPSILPDREQQPYPIIASAGPQRMLGSAPGGAYGSDPFIGSLLSSPAMAFTPATPFSYAGFAFGNCFPMTSTSFSGGSTSLMDSSSGGPCFPAVPSQLVGPAGAVTSQYMRPYMVSVPEGTPSVGAENLSQKWARQSLDLNAGPGSTDVGDRDDRLSSASRTLSLANTHVLAEEQLRIYQAAGGVLKRKEPEGGWDASRFSYKPPSWQ